MREGTWTISSCILRLAHWMHSFCWHGIVCQCSLLALFASKDPWGIGNMLQICPIWIRYEGNQGYDDASIGEIHLGGTNCLMGNWQCCHKESCHLMNIFQQFGGLPFTSQPSEVLGWQKLACNTFLAGVYHQKHQRNTPWNFHGHTDHIGIEPLWCCLVLGRTSLMCQDTPL